jgi:hypothetical protein
MQAAMSEEGATRFRQELAYLTYEVRSVEYPVLTERTVNYLVGLAMAGLEPSWKIAAHVASGTEDQLQNVQTHSPVDAGVQVSA